MSPDDDTERREDADDEAETEIERETAGDFDADSTALELGVDVWDRQDDVEAETVTLSVPSVVALREILDEYDEEDEPVEDFEFTKEGDSDVEPVFDTDTREVFEIFGDIELVAERLAEAESEFDIDGDRVTGGDFDGAREKLDERDM
jgi:hypothetical protein